MNKQVGIVSFSPSPYQAAIFDWVEGGRGHALVNAVAGAGKSTTLVQAAGLTRTDRAVFLAFNKHNAEATAPKLAGTGFQSRTNHSLGYGAVRKALGGNVQIDERKYQRIAEGLIRDAQAKRKPGAPPFGAPPFGAPPFGSLPFGSLPGADGAAAPAAPTMRELKADLAAAGNFLRLALAEPGTPHAAGILARHDAAQHPDLAALLPELLRTGRQVAEQGKVIDYTDQLWLVRELGLRLFPNDWVFVDECQDLSPAQLHVARAACGRGGRICAVGDPSQSVFGFAGADPESFERIGLELAATPLPLSICYRCPQAVVRHAQRLVPHIEWAPGAEEGAVVHGSREDLLRLLREGDMVLCRLTAPLVQACIECIERGMPATVKGRDLGAELAGLVERIEEEAGPCSAADLLQLLGAFELRRVALMEAEELSGAAIAAFRDKVQAVKACVRGSKASNGAGVQAYIRDLFRDGRGSITFSTVHRAKGLEADRVLILRPDALPLLRERQAPWELQQERNLEYVAITRARKELIYLHEPKKAAGPQAKEETAP